MLEVLDRVPSWPVESLFVSPMPITADPVVVVLAGARRPASRRSWAAFS